MGFVGILIVFGMVFGGFIIHGGKMGVIFHAAPTELMIILGAAFGGYVIGNPMKIIKMGVLVNKRYHRNWSLADL